MSVSVGGDGGVFKFIGGLVLGFVLRSVGGLLLEQVRAVLPSAAADNCSNRQCNNMTLLLCPVLALRHVAGSDVTCCIMEAVSCRPCMCCARHCCWQTPLGTSVCQLIYASPAAQAAELSFSH